ncbi:MAG: hypothetical protein AABZ60_24590 [Planctomycetota bacterium]
MKLYPLFIIMGYVTGGMILLLFLGSFFYYTRVLWLSFFKFFLFPWYLLKGVHEYRERKRKQYCRELCAEYWFILGQQPHTLRYFEQLIEEGIQPKELHRILEANLVHSHTLEKDKELQSLDAQYRNQANIAQFKAEREELLAQTQMALEQLRHKEKLLAKIYDKLKEKQKSEISLPQESPDE